MAARFRGEFDDQEGDDLAADDRSEDNERAPRACRREDARLIIGREQAEKGYVVNEPDQRPEQHGAEAGNHTDDDRQQRQSQQPQP